MNLDGFARTLPSLYGGDLDAEHPLDRRFRRLLDDVPGMASESKLALLELAGRMLEPGEIYVEVGAFKGVSIIAAALGNPTGRFLTIEDFSEFGMEEPASRAALYEHLNRWGVAHRVTVVEQDCFSAIGTTVTGPVGVYFYDGHHGANSHRRSIAAIEPVLAETALVIIDDASWAHVAQYTQEQLRGDSRFTQLFDLTSRWESDQRWWNGLAVYGYRAAGW